LPAVETLGSTTVICTDKTGTLTVGEMTVRALYVAGQTYEVTGEGYGPDGEVRFRGQEGGSAARRAVARTRDRPPRLQQRASRRGRGPWKTVGDPTEGALARGRRKAGGDRERIEKELPKHHEIPFDSDRKRSAVIRKLPDGKLRAFINGAPDVLLERCTKLYTSTGVRPLTDEDRARTSWRKTPRWRSKPCACSARPIAIWTTPTPPTSRLTNVEHDLVFVGLSGMYDPPRQEAKDAGRKCRAAGIRVVMITGDHPHTATAIAREIGIASADDTAIAGVELDKMSDDELHKRVSKIAVYARVTAEHKLRIIRAWKANDAVVAMTGDGVNDAPPSKAPTSASPWENQARKSPSRRRT
jgi:Ca2+-transporting ATPase